ncbi:zinc transport system substrate-binding protein [Cytobacillus oceanisediminis]|uniref:Zinc transport system substrate-binding protein n=1 Tax=Cytobacillus oceanisediminis TaxID=665099 RepID=A0A2V2ZP44_9BACI|nr:zinc ABC transporter substrate-binding protein [Cytobacillus oceanisediminis]PWW25786.1 zinc transport system substrate-binding protein [Cytobacillus oceanisediminis]
MKTKAIFVSILLILGSLVAGCSGTSKETVAGKDDIVTLTVFTTIFPLEDFTKKIGGKYVEVKSVYPPGIDAHTYEPTTKTMTQIAEADLFIYSGAGVEGFAEKAAETLKNEKVTILKAAEGIEFIKTDKQDHEEHRHEGEATQEEEHVHDSEVSHKEEHSQDDKTNHEEDHSHEGEPSHEEEHDHGEDSHNHGDIDPHVWLDPIRSTNLAENIKNALIKQMPQNEEEFEKNFLLLKNDLEALDKKYSDTVKNAKTKFILVSHAAYGYWEERYGIEQIAISGLSPTLEPSQKGLEKIIEESKAHDIHYVIFEQNVSPKVSEMIQKEIGADSLTLHNLEAVTEEDIKIGNDYFSIMEKNLEAIYKALN